MTKDPKIANLGTKRLRQLSRYRALACEIVEALDLAEASAATYLHKAMTMTDPHFLRSALENSPILQVEYERDDGFTCFAYNISGDRWVQHVLQSHIDDGRFYPCTATGEKTET